MVTKQSFAAGKFFTSQKEELQKTLEAFNANQKIDYMVTSRAIVAPHAGYTYSGQLAFNAFAYLDKNVKNIFIFAPTHKKTVNNLALCDCDDFETPLGNISVNKEIQKEIIEKFSCEYSDDAFSEEHAIEVQLPFIKYFFDDVKIVPILIGNDDAPKTLDIINHYYPNKENAFVVSTDLSHFLKLEEANQVDILTARMIEDKNIRGFRFEQACGAVPLCALTQFTLEHGYSLIRIGLYDSSRTTGDTSRVVGYGAWFLAECERNEFIKNNFSPKIIDVVKKTINAKLMGKTEINITSYFPYPPVLDSDCATFVTLEIDDELRGCIGSVLAHSPLMIDLIKNSHNAAFADPRFSPLTREEFEKTTITVSLLSSPSPIEFSSEEDLLQKLRPDIDGLIIKDKDYQALYLPEVWKKIPDRNIFLKSLKLKAGMTKDYFSDTFEAYRFTAEVIKSN